MKHTIFDTPGLRTIMGWISMIFLKLFGWRVEGKMPDTRKMVIIAAPHTSNWDLPYTLFAAFIFKTGIYWMGKDAIFKQPFRGLFRWLGGIPIDRSRSHSVVKQSIEQFNRRKRLALAISPAGTRTKVTHWKTGFYHIAVGAKVPIAMGYLDYKRKIAGIGPVFHPTGDLEADMKIIRAFYKDITGKHPEKATDTAMIKKTAPRKKDSLGFIPH